MGQDVRSLFRGRLLWLMGILLVVIVIFQYLEFPYGDVRILVSRNGTLAADASSLNPVTIDNITNLNFTNTRDAFLLPEAEAANGTGTSERLGERNINSTAEQTEHLGDVKRVSEKNDDMTDINVEDDSGKSNSVWLPENRGSSNARSQSSSPALPPIDSLTDMKYPEDATNNVLAPVALIDTSFDEDSEPTSDRNERWEPLENDFTEPHNKSLAPDSGVISISEMKQLLHQSRIAHHSVRPRWSSPVDEELLSVRKQIEKGPIVENDPVLHAPLFWNISTFKRSYELMENMLKVYIYKEGKRPIMHHAVLKGIYASEGWFMRQLKSSQTFVTKDPQKAHLFYLPFSSRMLEEILYVPDSHSNRNLVSYLKSYLDLISARYPFWNRTEGSDHFLVACHDWAPSETRQYMANCIRALCNSDVKEGFVFGKDVSLPETIIPNPKKPLRNLGGKPYSQRPILAFFAGGMHGYLRPVLLQYWGGNKDPHMKIFGELPKSKNNRNYIEHMKSSKYCICAKGYEVNSPRVVEAIFYECVPVIISDNFVPPFFEVLNWESFAVFILEKDIPNLKTILLSIPDKRYREMQMTVKKVQQHFLWHPKPEKYDIFHMILHSIWYNRVFQI